MTIEAALRNYLLSIPELTAQIGNRIYPMVLPQPPVFPAVTYSKISSSNVRDLSGISFYLTRIQFTCWSESYGQAKAIAESLRKPLECYKGTMGEFHIIDSQSVNEIDLSQPDSGLYQVPVDVLIQHQ